MHSVDLGNRVTKGPLNAQQVTSLSVYTVKCLLPKAITNGSELGQHTVVSFWISGNKEKLFVRSVSQAKVTRGFKRALCEATS